MEESETEIVNMFREAPWPGNTLSNFAKTPFVIDGIDCACSESFIQSLKSSDIDEQKKFCSYTGQEAWEKGSRLTDRVFTTGKVWWLGMPFDLHSTDHFNLVKRGLLAKFSQSEVALEALLASGDAVLTHDYGQAPGKKQSLPVEIFCQMVTEIRSEYRSQKDA